MYYNDYLAHHGVKGMKWGVRHDKKKGYRNKVLGRMQEYDSQHEERKRDANYNIVLRDEARKNQLKTMKRNTISNIASGVVATAGMAAIPLVGLGSLPLVMAAAAPIGLISSAAISGGTAFVGQFLDKHRSDTLSQISDEYNLEEAKRIMNV